MKYDKVQTSQPFLFKNDEGQKCLLYCRGIGKEKVMTHGDTTFSLRRWTIWFENLETGENYPLKIPYKILSSNFSEGLTLEGPLDLEIEQYQKIDAQNVEENDCKINLFCTPHFYPSTSNLRLQFIAGVVVNKTSGTNYCLASIDSSDLTFKNLSNLKLIRRTFSGSILPDGTLLYVEDEYLFKGLVVSARDRIIVKAPGNSELQEVDLSYLGIIDIYRVCPIYNSNYFTLTCTLQNDGENFHTFILSSDFKTGYEVFNKEGENVYKTSILDDILMYTVIEDFREETRRLETEIEHKNVLESITSNKEREIKLNGLIKYTQISHEEARNLANRSGGIRSARSKNSPPSLWGMANNFAAAMKDFAESGFLRVTQEQYQARMDICNQCEFWESNARMGLGKCLKCGCTGAKQWIATSECPIQKWGKITKEEVEASKEKENVQTQEVQSSVSEQVDSSSQEPSS